MEFEGNVHWETERHLELVTGGRTSTVHTLALSGRHAASFAGRYLWMSMHTRAWMPLRLIMERRI